MGGGRDWLSDNILKILIVGKDTWVAYRLLKAIFSHEKA